MSEPADRRAEPRFPVNADASCPFAAPVAEDLGPVSVKEVSMQGVGLLVRRRIDAGTLLAVTLASPSKGFARTVLVRVAHVTPVSGGFLVGGAFTAPLTYQEMSALVL